MFVTKNLIPVIVRSQFFLMYIVLAFVVSTVSCKSAKNKNVSTDSIAIIQLPEPSPIAASEVSAIKNACSHWYDSALKSSGFNGGMIVAKKGNIIFEKYSGTAHLPGKDTINENTSMHIASTSKTFTAMAILKLWQDGRLNIDDSVGKYLPGFNYPGITIRSLLSHRSGLPNYVHYMDDIKWDKNKMVTNEDVLQTLTDKKFTIPQVGAPNARFNYCNTNFALLALIVEKVSGEKFSVFMNETFFEPLQMKHTFIYTQADSGKVPMSYDWRSRVLPLNNLDNVYGDKNVYTTPRDLLIWDRALYSGKIFKPETLEQAFKPYSNEKAGIKNYGLGWRMYVYTDGKKVIYHNGWWHGSNAVFTRLIQDSATIIIIGNKFNRNIYHAKDLATIFDKNYTSTDDDETENNHSNVENNSTPSKANANSEEQLDYREKLLQDALQEKRKK